MACRRLVASILVLLVVPTCGCSKARDSDASPAPATDDKADLKKLAEQTLLRVKDENEQRTRALQAALETSTPSTDLGPCAIFIGLPSSHAATDAATSLEDATRFRMVSDRMTRVAKEDLSLTPGLRYATLNQRINDEVRRPARGLLAGKPEDTIKNLAEPQAFPWELVVIVERKVEPHLLDATTFEGGVIAGRAFVYDYLQKAVVCASSFISGSSNRLHTYNNDPRTGRETLLLDLENEAMRAAVAGLVRSRPRLDAGRQP